MIRRISLAVASVLALAITGGTLSVVSARELAGPAAPGNGIAVIVPDAAIPAELVEDPADADPATALQIFPPGPMLPSHGFAPGRLPRVARLIELRINRDRETSKKFTKACFRSLRPP